MEPADTVVVGSGLVGLLAAIECAHTGRRCLVIERGEPGRSGCSPGSAGLIRAGHHRPLNSWSTVSDGAKSLISPRGAFRWRPALDRLSWTAQFLAASRTNKVAAAEHALRELSNASLSWYRELAARTDGLVNTTGVIDAYVTEQAAERAVAAAAQREGAGSVEMVDAPSLGSLRIDPRHVVAALLCRDDLSVDPGRLLRFAVEEGRQLGVSFTAGDPVVGFDIASDRVAAVVTAAGTRIPVESVVVAAGAWTGGLLGQTGLQLRMQPGKGYHTEYLGSSTGTGVPPIMVPERRVVLSMFADRVRACGLLDLHGWSSSISERRSGVVETTACELVPELASRPQQRWAGFRPMTADGVPLVGPTERLANLVVAAGHGMQGIELAPASAKLVATALDAPTKLPAWAARLSPDRFARRRSRRPPHQILPRSIQNA